MDMNLLKRVRLSETTDMELRVDAVNVLNKPQFFDLPLGLNGPNFGRFRAANGNRQFTFNARVNF